MCDLCSVVFVLQPETPFIKRQFLGRAAQTLALQMLSTAGYPALAGRLHDSGQREPYTVSDLFQSDAHGTYYWLRVTGLQPHICEAILHMVDVLPGAATVDGWAVVSGVAEQHDWTQRSSYTALVADHWCVPPDNTLTFEFVTPTAIKSQGTFQRRPDPALVFRLLYEYMQQFDGIALDFQPDRLDLAAAVETMLTVTCHDIDSRPAPFRSNTVAFTGSFTCTATDNAGDAEDYLRLLHVLAAFAFYSGVGKWTAQGMGMVRTQA